MATSLLEKTIPSKYIRMDTNVTSAFEFNNVRDHQLMRKNHNILLAKGIRRQICSMLIMDDTESTVFQEQFACLGRPGGPRERRLLTIPIEVSSQCQQIRMVVTAKAEGQASSSTSAFIYPYVWTRFHAGAPNTNVELEINTSAASGPGDAFSIDLDVPPEASDWAWFGFSFLTPMYGSDTSSANTIQDIAADRSWVELSSGAPTGIGIGMYFDSHPEYGAYVIEKNESGTGTNRRLYTDFPISDDAVVGDDVSFRDLSLLTIESLSLYELEVSDFDSEVSPE